MTRILLVEDDEFLRTLLAQRLEKNNHEVKQAETGEKAVKMIAEYKPELVLLDLLLPGMHGFEVLTWIKKQREPLSKTPVIILSNLGAKEDIEKGINLGADDFLVKAKFTPQEIIEKIKTATQ